MLKSGGAWDSSSIPPNTPAYNRKPVKKTKRTIFSQSAVFTVRATTLIVRFPAPVGRASSSIRAACACTQSMFFKRALRSGVSGALLIPSRMRSTIGRTEARVFPAPCSSVNTVALIDADVRDSATLDHPNVSTIGCRSSWVIATTVAAPMGTSDLARRTRVPAGIRSTDARKRSSTSLSRAEGVDCAFGCVFGCVFPATGGRRRPGNACALAPLAARPANLCLMNFPASIFFSFFFFFQHEKRPKRRLFYF